ncbi:hypothetical protein Cgig2_015656 [Carnegiea gigantea]|uniref:Uncharacterized protein n=1 Tax=Carnegiea gigantea TaxID=171969 RepID=A0A9Q1JXK4_9CARY|nr:hypothetical protein Cgig2_015656 [Carnegiea gigantea]
MCIKEDRESKGNKRGNGGKESRRLWQKAEEKKMNEHFGTVTTASGSCKAASLAAAVSQDSGKWPVVGGVDLWRMVDRGGRCSVVAESVAGSKGVRDNNNSYENVGEMTTGSPVVNNCVVTTASSTCPFLPDHSNESSVISMQTIGGVHTFSFLFLVDKYRHSYFVRMHTEFAACSNLLESLQST